MVKTNTIPIVKPHCGMCTHSRPEPESKNVYCGRYPPTIQHLMRNNPLTKQVETMAVSMLPDTLKDIVCGEFQHEDSSTRDLCEINSKKH